MVNDKLSNNLTVLLIAILLFILYRITVGCTGPLVVGSGSHAHLDPTYNSSAYTDMPSLDRPAGGALALHYAAARGCIDCVRLLVEASPEIR